MITSAIKQKISKCYADNDPQKCAEIIYETYGYEKGVEIIKQIAKQIEISDQKDFLNFWNKVRKCSLN